MPPSLLDAPEGCRFAARCPARIDACVNAAPPLVEVQPQHWSACVRSVQMSKVGPAGLGLQSANPQPPEAKALTAGEPLLRVHDLRTYFEVAAGMKLLKSTHVEVRAVDGLSLDRKSTRLNSSHTDISRMPSSA